MSKAVLVMDMPSKCRECLCWSINNRGDAICKAKRKFIDTGDGSKPNWCPLRELPEKKDLKELAKHSLGEDYIWSEGWNACINEILGEQED